MRTLSTALITILTACSALAATPDGFLTLSASGVTNAVVHFPAGSKPLRVTSIDVTGDAADSLAKWYVGGSSATIVLGTNATATNLWVKSSTITSNSTILVQGSSGQVTNATVYGRFTNLLATVLFGEALYTNLAIGDTFAERQSTAYTLLTWTTNDATSFLLNSTNGLYTADTVVAEYAGAIYKGTVSAGSTIAMKNIGIRVPVPQPLAVGDVVYERTTTKTNIAATLAADEVSLHVYGTNGFTAADVIVIEKADGSERAVRTVDSTGTTNVTVTVAAGFALAAGDLIHLLSTTTYTVGFPAAVGDTSLILSSTNGLITNDVIIAASSIGSTWRGNIGTAVATPTNISTLTLSAALGANLPAQDTKFYRLFGTNYTVILPASKGGFTADVNASTHLAAGDIVVVTTADSKVYRHTIRSIAALLLDRIALAGTLGMTVTANDNIYELGTAISRTIGVGTLRLDGPNIFVAPPGRPAQLSVNGGTNSYINQVIGTYAP